MLLVRSSGFVLEPYEAVKIIEIRKLENEEKGIDVILWY